MGQGRCWRRGCGVWGTFGRSLIAEPRLDVRRRFVVPLDAQVFPVGAAPGRVEALSIHRVTLAAQMPQRLVAAAGGSLVAECADIERSDDDFFARAGIGLRQD